MNKNIHHFKKIIKNYGAFALITLLLIISTTSTVALANLSTVTVKANTVNVRVGPGLSYNSLTQVKKGDKLTVIDKKNSWWQVRLSGDKVGWVASWLLNNTEVSSSSNHIGVITESGANVYTTDNTSSKILGTIQPSQKVNVVFQEEGWNQILYGNTVGWVQNDNIETTGKVAGTINKPQSNPNSNNNTGHKLKEDNIKSVTTVENDTKLRSIADTSGEVLETLPANQTLTFISQQGDWYKVKTKSGTTGWIANWLVTISDSNKPVKVNASNLSEATIVLDAGHGGKDVGAETINGKNHEADYTLKVIKKIKDKLEQSGANVILTRDSNNTVSLGTRTRLSNQKNADAFISVHFDSSDTNNSASGITTYYYEKSKDYKLAKSLDSNLNNLTLNNRGTDFGNFYVLRENNRPSVLLELGYINSDNDFKQISSNKYQTQVANDVYQGLVDYFK
ncbi:N-acetylmuramoyl-L-alanine amidase [Companilactobacillus sp. DQM5]|uniref:N-acetylmuramoyl-L-alanine amidase n=1 Tax=Companilactobacillus sp. DQM5 TaxID=3463359 RepID=UPI0040583940